MYEALVARVRYHIQKANFMGLKDAESTLLLNEAADAIEKLQRQIDAWVEPERKALIKSLPRWIPVTERLPQQGIQYLVCRKAPNGETVIETLWHDGKKLWWNRLYTPHGKITHWMPLPQPPKEET